MSVHYHPDVGVLAPSMSDLELLEMKPLLDDEEWDVRPTLGLASIDNANNGVLLMIRRTAPPTKLDHSPLIQAYHEAQEWPDFAPDRVAAIYTFPDFVRAAVIRFSLKPRSEYANLGPTANSALRAFAF